MIYQTQRTLTQDLRTTLIGCLLKESFTAQECASSGTEIVESPLFVWALHMKLLFQPLVKFWRKLVCRCKDRYIIWCMYMTINRPQLLNIRVTCKVLQKQVIDEWKVIKPITYNKIVLYSMGLKHSTTREIHNKCMLWYSTVCYLGLTLHSFSELYGASMQCVNRYSIRKTLQKSPFQGKGCLC